MSSNSIQSTGVQSEGVSDAGNVAGVGVNDGMDVDVCETHVKEPDNVGSGVNDTVEEEGLEREDDSVGMEVDFDGESVSAVDLMDSKPVVGEVGDGSLEGEMSSYNVVDVGDAEGGSNASGLLEKSVCEAEKSDLDDKGSVEGQEMVQKALNDGGIAEEVKVVGNNELLPYAEKTVDGKVVGVSYSVGANEVVGGETNVVIRNEESDRGRVEGGVMPETKGVDVAVTLDKCAGKDAGNSKKKAKFCAPDLVWGKVRSHPWWPGQIFEPGDASDKARKHFRPKSYLVAYFGDHTFAWNDNVKLKPFVPHFSQMVKQTSMDAFRHAVDCALDEISRRVEFGLSCRCIKYDVYSQLKIQDIENAGVQEQQIVHEHVDRNFTASSFEPVELLDYISSLAVQPLAEVDKLEHVMARGRISAFYRWKGYCYLPEFAPLIGYVNNEADSAITDQKDEKCKVIEHEKVGSFEKCKVIEHEKVGEGTVEEHGSKPEKRKNLSGDDCHPTKREKCLADMIPKKGSYKLKGDEKTGGKADRKSISSSSSGSKASKLLHNGLKTQNSSRQSEETTPIPSKNLKPSFSVGQSILRVAGQLSKPSPLLKLDVLSHGKTAKKAKGGRKQTPRQTKVGPAQHSFDDILSLLLLAAREPLEDHGMLTSMVNFFSDFRNSVVQEDDFSEKHEESGGTDVIGKSEEGPARSATPERARSCSPGGTSKEKASDSDITTASGFDAAEDACCTKITTASEQKICSSDEYEPVVVPEFTKVARAMTVQPQKEQKVLGSMQHTGSQIATSEHGQFDGEMQQEDSPTALTLKFTDVGSIPSAAKLNKVFCHFGPLRETETQILTKKNCARVVFKRRLDAETAFSTSGKFEIFGPSLVCYRLNDAPSPRKSPSAEAKRRRKEESPEEGNGA